MSMLFGSAAGRQFGAPAGGYLGGGPDLPNKPSPRRNEEETPLLRWCRETRSELKRERQGVTETMKRNVNLARGGTPWWRNRPKWKIGTKLNYCARVPLTWTAILCDAKPTITYSALDKSKQRIADIATALYDVSSKPSNRPAWDQVIHDAVLISQVQGVGYLSLRPRMEGDQVSADLKHFLGEQVYVDQNARSPQDAETLIADYYESYGSLCGRLKGLREKLERKYQQQREDDKHKGKSVLAPPATYSFGGLTQSSTGPATSGGASASGTVTTPAYAAQPSPPAGAGGTAGMHVEEFWTQPKRTVQVEEVQFLASGEPATRQKYYETIDEIDEEPLRRIVTEGGVVYEIPQSLADMLEDFGELKVLSNQPALEAVTHTVEYLLYPNGRIVIVVDDDIIADDRMNPLGYIPFIKLSASSDPGGGYYGQSSVDLIADVYEQLVRVVSLIYDTANLSGNTWLRIWEGEPSSNDDFTNAPGSITRESIQSLRFSKREPPPDLPNYIPQYVKFLIEQIKELSGLSDIMTGKIPPKQQVSTETATIHQEASGVPFRDALSSITDAMRLLGEQFLEFTARFTTSPVVVQITNNLGDKEPVPVLGAMLTDPLIVEAKAGSRQPSGPTQRLQTLFNLRNSGVPIPLETVFDLLEEIGAIPSSTAMMREIERLMSSPTEKWKLLLPPQPKPQQQKKPGSKASRKGAALGVA